MKKILIALLTTISAVVLLFSYRTSTQAIAPTALDAAPADTGSDDAGTAQDETTPEAASTPTPSASSTPAGSDASSGSSDTGSSDSSGTASASGTGLKDGTYTGTSVNTRFGPVQVRITISGGKITEATAITYPSSSGRDVAINRYAIPQLQQETVSAQSANIDMVSGATYTSDGYIGSLQSALDQAKS